MASEPRSVQSVLGTGPLSIWANDDPHYNSDLEIRPSYLMRPVNESTITGLAFSYRMQSKEASIGMKPWVDLLVAGLMITLAAQRIDEERPIFALEPLQEALDLLIGKMDAFGPMGLSSNDVVWFAAAQYNLALALKELGRHDAHEAQLEVARKAIVSVDTADPLLRMQSYTTTKSAILEG